MIMSPQFAFHGDAAGVAAFVRRRQNQNIDETLPVKAASSLPVIGGHAEQTVNGNSLDPFLAFQTATTSADGRFVPAQNAYVTTVTASVTGAVVALKFVAQHVVAQLVSTHPGDTQQPQISWAGSEFAGLTLEGYPVTVVLDASLLALTTEQALVSAYQGPAFQQQYCERMFRSPQAPQPAAGEPIPRVGRSGYIACSIVQSIQTTHPTAVVQGHVLTLADFGSVYFGELLVLPDSRRLTMLRFELGSHYAGSLSLSGVRSDGERLP